MQLLRYNNWCCSKMKSTLQDEKSSYKKKRISCPKCGSTNLALEEHETYCRECGLVIQGVPGIQHYPYGYIIGGKRLMYKIVKITKKE